MRVLVPRLPIHDALHTRAASAAKSTEGLFGPAKPELVIPEAPTKVRVMDSVMTKVATCVGAGALGYLAASTGGGMLGRSLGLAAGLVLFPLAATVASAAVAPFFAGKSSGGGVAEAFAKAVGILAVGSAAGFIGGPVAGWMIGGAELGPLVSSLVGLGTAAGGLIALSTAGRQGREDYDSAVKEATDLHEKEMTDYQERRAAYELFQTKKDVSIEIDEDYLLVGDVPLRLSQ